MSSSSTETSTVRRFPPSRIPRGLLFVQQRGHTLIATVQKSFLPSIREAEQLLTESALFRAGRFIRETRTTWTGLFHVRKILYESTQQTIWLKDRTAGHVSISGESQVCLQLIRCCSKLENKTFSEAVEDNLCHLRFQIGDLWYQERN